MTEGPRLWAIVGATGTGKSDLALNLAEILRERGNPAEIVNADAMQLYRGMDTGTAKVPPAERRGIPHHLFDVREVDQEAAVAWYQPLARAAIAGIHERGGDAILVGGSGLYVSSVVYEFHFPPRDPAVRERLESELAADGLAALLARLRVLDPATAARVDPHNDRRVIRALEVLEQGGVTHGAVLPERPELWHRPTRVIGLSIDRPALVERLDARVQQMWGDGLVDEALALRERGLERGTTAQRAIGYSQALKQVDGELTQEQAIAETQALTRRYARRQVSWFKRYAEIEWKPAPVAAERLVEN
ncbi:MULTISPECIES: tRNA (adenosine(37)-N6)-dimethylallyltransferase MiaA [unclassified Microbacterium]|uniref:tRNA (adenosine(37)-N6)-dimethylallyltransferase MiaA n=1 Tax=unclassified Microbacterium TaxID=2609290 RepID=UPI000EA9816D|nr:MULTISPECIES: tRNA (adenosine(37)-N6)-dimethylallyltransferase MiaA [unclassified Microbacterium]MBT2485614.1 tRNA (adenosine(37)-N6)-dimethylallyltransferase MiaA [Microbacterium sp. ISL-108]RKN68393.1 tRNA (adenosine(37)-N6)-dimethylallyltransferase MiaA [Microbacterium sp. CGR2]